LLSCSWTWGRSIYATRAAFLSDGDDGTTGGGDVPIEGEGVVEFQWHEKVVIDQNHLVLPVKVACEQLLLAWEQLPPTS
jgi:hypothetical protein